MKDWSIHYVKYNLPKLIRVITWNSSIKASLLADGVFSECDVSEVEDQTKQFERTHKLLELLLTKWDKAYEDFMKILYFQNQYEAFTIFLIGLKTNEPERWESYCLKYPNQFDDAGNVLLKSTTMDENDDQKTTLAEEPSAKVSKLKVNVWGIEVEVENPNKVVLLGSPALVISIALITMIIGVYFNVGGV